VSPSFSIGSSGGGSAVFSRRGADPNQDAVLEVLAGGGWHPRGDFEGAIRTHSVDTLKRRLNSLLETREIVKEGNAKATGYALAGNVVFEPVTTKCPEVTRGIVMSGANLPFAVETHDFEDRG
jgi:hypothetical protein